jgi:hypothetical protein
MIFEPPMKADEADAHPIKVEVWTRGAFVVSDRREGMRVMGGRCGNGHDQISPQKVVLIGFFKVTRFCHGSVNPPTLYAR